MSSGATRWAQVLSFIGYPYFLVPLAIVLSGTGSKGALAVNRQLVSLLSAIFVAVGLLTWRKVKQGQFSNFDVSVRKERTAFYPVLLLALGSATGLFWYLEPNHGAGRVLMVCTMLLVVCFALNQWVLKVSLHAAFGVVAAAIPWRTSLVASVMLGLLVVAVCWSRIYLGRHTRNEVLTGLGVGLIAGVSLIFV